MALASFLGPRPASVACSTVSVLQVTEAGLGSGNEAKSGLETHMYINYLDPFTVSGNKGRI